MRGSNPRASRSTLYRFAAEHARARNIIIADTKFEFGIDKAGALILIDEALTPDSSRFWPMASYKPGISPPSFDKQFVRDYLESLHWNKKPPRADAGAIGGDGKREESGVNTSSIGAEFAGFVRTAEFELGIGDDDVARARMLRGQRGDREGDAPNCRRCSRPAQAHGWHRTRCSHRGVPREPRRRA